MLPWLAGCGGGGGAPVDPGPPGQTEALEWLLRVDPPGIEGSPLTPPQTASRSLLPAGWQAAERGNDWRFHFDAPQWDPGARRLRVGVSVENRGSVAWQIPLLVLDGITEANGVSLDDPQVRGMSARVLPAIGASLSLLEGTGGDRSLRQTTSFTLPGLALSPLEIDAPRAALALTPSQLPPGERSQPVAVLLALDLGLRSVRLRVHLDVELPPVSSAAALTPALGEPLALPVRDGAGEWVLPGKGARYLFVVSAFGETGRSYPLQLRADAAGPPVVRQAADRRRARSSSRPLCDIAERLRDVRPPPRRQRLSLRGLQEGDRFDYVLSIPGTPTQRVQAVVLKVGSVGVWVTEAESIDRLSPADLDRLRASFEERIVPRERLLLGPPPDVNGDGLMLVFLTRRVNDAGRYGFFIPGDLIGADGMEVLYSALPDQRVSLESIESTMAHELQHVYHYYYTVIRRQQQGERLVFTPSTPVNEGLAFLIEELAGFGDESASGRAKAWEFLQRGPEQTSLYGIDAGGQFDNKYQRGVTYLLLRYLFEQAGGVEWQSGNRMVDHGGAAFLQQLLRLRATGLTALDHLSLEVADRSYARLLQDWALALALDGLGGEKAPYRFEPPTTDPDTGAQQGIDLRGSFITSDTREQLAFDGPLVHPFSGTLSGLGRLQSHSVGYSAYQAPDSAHTVRFELQADAPDDAVRAWVVRTG